MGCRPAAAAVLAMLCLASPARAADPVRSCDFAPGRAGIGSDCIAFLDLVARRWHAAFRDGRCVSLLVEGHSTDGETRELALRRAIAVASALWERDVPNARMTVRVGPGQDLQVRRVFVRTSVSPCRAGTPS